MKRTAVVFLALALAASAASAQGVSFKDALGRQISLPAKASRVISLSPAITEILFASGAGPAVVAVTSYCNYPQAANDLPEIGAYSADTISVEGIVALKPDLVLGEPAMHGKLIAQFEAAGIRFAALKLTSFDDVFASINTCGLATGNASSATAVVASLKARLKAVTDKLAKVAEDKRPLVFYEVWDEPLMTAGPGTFIGQVIKAAGGRNVFADLTEDWPMVSFEALVLRKPDIIIASNTHAEALSAQKLAARPGWANLKAVKERRIFLLDGDVLSRPGPRFVEAVELIAKALYPSLF